MKILFLSTLVALFSTGALAAHKTKALTGPCARQAIDIVQSNWSNVPNPDPSLEFDAVSSNVDPKDENVYSVKWGQFDGNQGLILLSKVTTTTDCKQNGDIETKTIGGFDP